MYLALSGTLFKLLATIATLGLAFEYYEVVHFLTNTTHDSTAYTVPTGVIWVALVAIFTFLYFDWMAKRYYFFKLKGLVRHHMTENTQTFVQNEFTDPRISVTRQGSSYVITKSMDGDVVFFVRMTSYNQATIRKPNGNPMNVFWTRSIFRGLTKDLAVS